MLWPRLIDREVGLAESEKSGWTTVTVAAPLRSRSGPRLLAVTAYVPAVEPGDVAAAWLMVPPVAVHANVGCVTKATPFWS